MKPTIDTYHQTETPARSPRERSHDEFSRDNKPTPETRENGLIFVKPMKPNAYKPYNPTDMEGH